ncbi:alpha/beta fold hydrolase [Spirulina sp. CS-785/01]|uniref:alpha/beta hydrolase n=1 Tax=Spirulina sp. CS-785/01 TaxID=3021716 RepID=UPI002330AA17|nr:alpha/beta fold hydrolase [Spirulina sp. CS-785/01]MDB9313177.1 alpha/beta fold hydrolase [Spirulina sp. CS-785/01]
MKTEILDDAKVLNILFHPRPETNAKALDKEAIPWTIQLEDEVQIGGWLYPSKSAEYPAILFFHGNGELAADYHALAEFFTDRKMTFCVVDYRGYGRSEGTPTASNLLADAHPIFKAFSQILAEHDLNPAKRYVMGRSLGSVPAIELAYHYGEDLDGLIVESGFVDTYSLIQRLGGSCPEFDDNLEGFGNGRKLLTCTLPTLILHGEEDTLIPITEAEELYSCCASDDKFLRRIPQAGHNTVMVVGMAEGEPIYFDTLQRFIFQHEQFREETELYFEGE